MRTTLNIDEQLFERARQLTGIPEKTTLLNAGLEALIQLHGSRRLAALGGSEPGIKPAPRRRLPRARQ